MHFHTFQAKRRLELDITDHQYSDPTKTAKGKRGPLQPKSPKSKQWRGTKSMVKSFYE